MKKLLLSLLMFAVFVLFPGAARSQVRTFCIDFAGGDNTASGRPATDCHSPNNHAWKCNPFQSGIGGGTAGSGCPVTPGVGIATYLAQAADQFIHKGGVIWDGSAFDGNLSGGNGTGMSVYASGTSGGNNIYIGADTQWFSTVSGTNSVNCGSSFCRPIFTGCKPGATFAGCDAGTSNFTQTVGQLIVIENNVSFITVDNIELRHLYVVSAQQITGGTNVLYGRGANGNIRLSNLNVHGWWVQQQTQVCSGSGFTYGACDAHYGGVIFNNLVACSSGITCYDGDVLTSSVIHNEDGGVLNTDGTAIQYAIGPGYAITGIQKVNHNYFHDLGNIGVGGGEEVTQNLTNNLISMTTIPVVDTSNSNSPCCLSTNGFYVGWWQGQTNSLTRPCYIHHNIFINAHDNTAQIYPTPTVANGPTVINCYVYANVVYSGATSGGVYFDPDQTTTGDYLGLAYNNTVFTPNGSGNLCYQVGARDGHTMSLLTFRNNQCILGDDNGNPENGVSLSANTVTPTDDGNRTGTGAWNYLEESPGQAATDNYNAANLYAPLNTSAKGVNVGTVLSCSACPDFTLGFDANVNQATYFTTHGQNFALVARPTSGHWDVGAYQQFARLLAGDQSVEGTMDFAYAGTAQADQVTASSTGSVKFITFYVDSGNLATTWKVGLYSDSSGNPGTLLTSGTNTSITNGAWNSVSVSAVNVSSGTAYWIAVLSPNGGGTAKFRDNLNGGCNSQSSQSQSLTALPSTWTTGTIYNTNCPLSAYASGQ